MTARSILRGMAAGVIRAALPPAPDNATAQPTGPVSTTAAAAVDVLQAELKLAHDALDSIDRKAAVLPPVVVGLAALILRSDDTYAPWQVVVIALALVLGVMCVVMVLRLVQVGETRLGPKAEVIAAALHDPTDLFNAGVTRSLAESVEFVSTATAKKGRAYRRATNLAVTTIVLLAVARLGGGITMTDNQQPAPTSGPSAPAPSSTPSDAATPAPTVAPSGPAPTAPAPTSAPPVGDYGQQVAERGGWPDYGQQSAVKGGPVPREIERRIIEKGG